MRVFFFTCVGLVVAIGLGISLGSVSTLSWSEIYELRVPRVLLSACIGAGLAVSGAILQALFRNPLCDPYTLGVSSGAALGAVLGTSVGFASEWFGLSLSAFSGSILFSLVLVILSSSRASTSMLLLTGVMLGFLGSGLVSLWMALTDPSGLMGALQWQLGDLSRGRNSFIVPVFMGVGLATVLIWRRHRTLDLLMLGEEDARSLGVDLIRERRILIFYVSALIGISVCVGGMIGFLGLIVPHFARKVVGSLHLRLIPQCALMGAAFLVLSDLASRIVLSPLELPVGVLTSLIGAPFFVWILIRNRGVA